MYCALRDRLTCGLITLLAIGSIPFLSGCGAMPAHSNTLVFGTTTKVAVDVSSEPTGTLGVTIGYKRSEAVWMPLIANGPGDGGKQSPVACGSDECTKLVGTPVEDTYSVLATFSGDTAGSAANAEAKGKVVQYFATGFAARELARTGGAAAVNSAAATPAEGNLEALAAAQVILDQQTVQVKSVLKKATKADGSFDSGVWKALLNLPEVVKGVPVADIAVLSIAADLQNAEKALRAIHLGYLNTISKAASTLP